MKATCMNQLELAVRWGISHRTLERWRWTGEGPKFLKVGGRVVYRLSDVEEYERSITSSASSPYFLVYQAAQVKLGDLGFLSRDITVRDLLLNRSDVHHVYPRNHLKKQGMARGRYNQIANFVLAQSEINIGIGDRSPEVYFAELADQCNGGAKKYGGITDMAEMRANLRMSCLPETLLDGEIPDFGDFLEARRKLMAAKIKTYFEGL